MTDMKVPPLPSGIEGGIIILTRDTLEEFRARTYAAGVARGRYETSAETPYHYTVQGHGIVDAVCDVLRQGYHYSEGDIWCRVQEQWESFKEARDEASRERTIIRTKAPEEDTFQTGGGLTTI